jgi:hypothetical protein
VTVTFAQWNDSRSHATLAAAIGWMDGETRGFLNRNDTEKDADVPLSTFNLDIFDLSLLRSQRKPWE